MKSSIMRGTYFLHTLLATRFNKGDVVIDGTMGNGFDTLFLARQVGIEGKVYAFDIQATSLEKTAERLLSNKIDPQVGIQLIYDGHENIDLYVKEEVDGAMFNLGYLPGGDHSLITRSETTVKALKSVLKLLKKRGLISLMIYYGHEGGTLEKNSILEMVESLPSNEFSVMKTEYINRDNNPPIIVIIERK
ncbi:class I SAM-dependent methyltransferase [Alkaliphilus hydrothermalis]|uniref:Ubiquinone/menaquinone biosynthesis C-methylase UbiE n=1 Tax=Alkaliphilus hydrothermalis TaxID=1482730 RepID=A0ABS2NMB3_9FIRM|nr:class I SAM-dependent methyltransferase [Alkaliphilus hydrothermalis]MBM7614085.1 ubiquinone/menaquinone biosynthesis C-methylase UbiE [Alkaliphilus hydrothermalis]